MATKIIERIVARNVALAELLDTKRSDAERRAALERMLSPRPESPGYAARVRELEEQGLTTSDAQGVADAEEMQCGR
jgi:hypothetical protein